jgi:hypothetical protein
MENHDTTDYHRKNLPPRKPWYISPWYYHGNITVMCTMVEWVVQLYYGITMVQLYNPKNHGTFYHGNTVVKSTMVFEVVQLYHPENHGTFTMYILGSNVPCFLDGTIAPL